MGLSRRALLLDQDDGLFWLPNTKFEQMFRDPTNHRIPRFAGEYCKLFPIQPSRPGALRTTSIGEFETVGGV